MLIVLAGLPGVGKTSIGRQLANQLKATYLRIDTIEHAIRAQATPGVDVADGGYVVAYRIAEDNLRLGQIVIADSVNPIEITREAWLGVARTAAVPMLDVEIICSNQEMHRRRVETRQSDIAGLELPTWDAVQAHEYHAWSRAHLIVDSATKTIDECVAEVISRLRERGLKPGTPAIPVGVA